MRTRAGVAALILVIGGVGACASMSDPVARSAESPSPTGIPTRGSVAPTAERRPGGFPAPTLPSLTPQPAVVPPAGVGPSPAPFPTPWTPEIAVQATVRPACVQRGGKATITIVTQPEAGVAYHAVYAGTKGGAPPPFGHGYGGDAGGFTDANGRYTSSWVVSPAAPVGPARVDVIVGWDEKWGYAGPAFAVAGPSGAC